MQKKYYDKKRKARSYAVSNLVLLSTKNLKIDLPKKKIGLKFVRLFYFINIVSMQLYRLVLLNTIQIYNIFYIFLLELQTSRENPKEVVIMLVADKVEEQEVKEILQAKKVKGQIIYLIKQKGQLEDYATFEPYNNIKGYKALDAFKAKPKYKRREQKLKTLQKNRKQQG